MGHLWINLRYYQSERDDDRGQMFDFIDTSQGINEKSSRKKIFFGGPRPFLVNHPQTHPWLTLSMGRNSYLNGDGNIEFASFWATSRIRLADPWDVFALPEFPGLTTDRQCHWCLNAASCWWFPTNSRTVDETGARIIKALRCVLCDRSQVGDAAEDRLSVILRSNAWTWLLSMILAIPSAKGFCKRRNWISYGRWIVGRTEGF
jgi:hypothetical protein